MRVPENRVMKRIFGNKWEQVTGECRQLHTDELHNVFSAPHVTKVDKISRAYITYRTCSQKT